ncbi:CRISPR-associated endonuclease Cas1 [Clostridium vitabionis]|uniref:CRISPR-associated endonuclease Cas1 n=1 Tax=Clostridium vitabionis TaxID=2784388 RepID=UPI001F253DB4|nr:CRISPR-associated endonuclease Cas1 [Clostridium vitabionis]
MNTIYVTNEQAYLTLENNNLVCSIKDETKLKVPLDNIEGIVCFSYLGCSPSLMGECVKKRVPINYVSPGGKFLAKVYGETKGNVFLRVQQIDRFREQGLQLAKNETAAKFSNCIATIKRTLHDHPELKADEKINHVVQTLEDGITKAEACSSLKSLLGIEGNCASSYFSIFPKLIIGNSLGDTFQFRNMRPPLDPVNALLSFAYTLETMDCSAALETVGLDSYIGFYHTLRSGRPSLACDMVEEFRSIGERFVLTLLNLKIIGEKDFDHQVTGAVLLNENGRKKFIQKWQEKKRTMVYHPIIREKIPYGLLPYVQSNLLAKYVRGEMEEYIPVLLKQFLK